VTISLSIFVRMGNILTKVTKKIKTHILCSITFIPENRAVYEIMWKSVVEQYGPQMTIQRMFIVC